MRIEWAWKNKSSDKEQKARSYIESKLERLERHLSRYPEDQRKLSITVYHLPNQVKSWEARFVLQLPTGTLVAEEGAESVEAALDVAFDELIREVRKHKEKVRKEYLYRRKRQRETLAEVVPLVDEQTIAEQKEAFFRLLQPFLGPVREHARQEIDILEIEQDLPRHEVTADDIVDDVVATAWEKFSERPTDRPLDVWLLDLLHQRLDEVVHNRESVLMGQVERDPREEPLTPSEDMEEEDFWLERLFGAQDVETLDELIPDEKAAEAWESLSDEGRRERIRSALASLPAAMRRALVLHIMQGYDLDEIAMVQDRSVDAVREDIEAGKRKLHELLACEAPG